MTVVAIEEGFDPERWAKLPRWAQEDLRRAMRRIRELRERVEAGPENSNTFTDPYGANPTPLGINRKIGFYLPEGRYTVEPSLRTVGVGGLTVFTQGLMLIQPRSGNSVDIRNVTEG